MHLSCTSCQPSSTPAIDTHRIYTLNLLFKQLRNMLHTVTLKVLKIYTSLPQQNRLVPIYSRYAQDMHDAQVVHRLTPKKKRLPTRRTQVRNRVYTNDRQQATNPQFMHILITEYNILPYLCRDQPDTVPRETLHRIRERTGQRVFHVEHIK